MTGTVIGKKLGLPRNGRRVTFGIFHVVTFHRGLLSRERVRIDSGCHRPSAQHPPGPPGAQARLSQVGAGPGSDCKAELQPLGSGSRVAEEVSVWVSRKPSGGRWRAVPVVVAAGASILGTGLSPQAAS